MRAFFLKDLGALATRALPQANLKCEDPHCDHLYCIKDPDSGEWYKTMQEPCPPQEDELIPALLAAQLKELKAVKSMLVFFTVLTALGLLLAVVLPALVGGALFR